MTLYHANPLNLPPKKPQRESKGQGAVGFESLKDFAQLGFLDIGARVSVICHVFRRRLIYRVYVPEPEHPKYLVPSDDDIQVEDRPYINDALLTAESPGYIADLDSMEEDSIDYPDEPKDDDEHLEEDEDEDPSEEHEPEEDDVDPKKDPSKEHEPEPEDEDPKEDPSKEHELEDEDTKEEEPSEGSDETESFEEDETAALIDAFAARSPLLLLPLTIPTYDQEPLGHRTSMIRMRDDILEEDILSRRRFVLTAPPPGYNVVESSAAAARPPKGQYDFVDTVEVGQGLIRSPSHDTQTIARVADKAEDVGYVRALQASEHIMINSIEEVNLRVSYQAQVRRRESKDFYTHLHDARTDRKVIRLEIDVVKGQRTAYETELHERQSAKDFAVRQMMRTQVLEARARIDTVEDASRTQLRMRIALIKEVGKSERLSDAAFAIELGDFLEEIVRQILFQCGGSRNSKLNCGEFKDQTLDFAIELANDLMDQKLRTYAERQNENKRKAEDSSRNNHQRQSHKRQNCS
ncbi:hypothetical protein Tco_0313379 [Tanacetum coccineum]